MKVTAFARSYGDAHAAQGNVAFQLLLLAPFFSIQGLWGALSVTESWNFFTHYKTHPPQGFKIF